MSVMVGAAESNNMAATELQLRVDNIEKQAGGSVAVITLARPDGGEMPPWSPGAHVDVVLPNGIVRQYSLCGVGDKTTTWRLGVLREQQSRGGSEYVHTSLRVGDLITIRGPRNNFPLVDSERYVFVAGGIGITPFLPMIEEVHRRGADWSLVYGGRSRSTMAFLDELAQYGDRVTLWPQDEVGLIDVKGIVERLTPGAVVYCCGPEPLIAAMEEATAHLPEGTLNVERFRPREDLLYQEGQAFEVYLDYSQITVHVGPDQTIVEALEAVGIEVLTSCREGTCGTCETRVLEGIPDHRDSYLSQAERASNETMMRGSRLRVRDLVRHRPAVQRSRVNRGGLLLRVGRYGWPAARSDSPAREAVDYRGSGFGGPGGEHRPDAGAGHLASRAVVRDSVRAGAARRGDVQPSGDGG